MIPTIWGPVGHDFILFMISESYPEQPTLKEQMKMESILTGIFEFLPCKSPCSNNAIQYHKEKPFRYTSKQSLLEDYVAFHNHINATKTYKSKSNWTVLEALQAAHSRYGTSLRSLDRATQMRAEDHRLLQEVIDENNQLRTQLGKPWRRDIENMNGLQEDNNWNMKSIKDLLKFSNYFESFDPNQWSFDVTHILVAVFAMLFLFIVIMCILG